MTFEEWWSDTGRGARKGYTYHRSLAAYMAGQEDMRERAAEVCALCEEMCAGTRTAERIIRELEIQ